MDPLPPSVAIRTSMLNRKVDCKKKAQNSQDERQYERDSAVVQAREVIARKRKYKASMLDPGEDHGYGAEQHEGYSNIA